MSRKLLIILSLMLSVSILLSACKPAEVMTTPEPTQDVSTEPVNLRFTTWTGNETQLKLLNDIGDEYTAMHPNVSIKFETVGFGDYIQKVSIELAGSDPPDAGWMLETAAISWINAGALADMGPILKSDTEYNYDDFSPKALALWESGGKVFGIPFSTSPNFVYYNADLFTAAGIDTPDVMLENGEWTFENFAIAAKAIQDNAPEGTYGFGSSGMFTGSGPIYLLTPIIRSFGGEFWSDDYTTCMMNKPEAVQAITFLQDMLLKDKSVLPPGETVAFSEGKIGMYFGQISHANALEEATFDWAIAPIPSGPAGSVPTIGQAAVVTFAASKNAEIATDFVAYLTSEENVAKMAQFWPPARVSVLESGAIAKTNPNLDPNQIKIAITDSIINGKVVSSHPDFAKVQLALAPFIDQLWTPGADVQDLMDQACDALAPYFE